MNPGTGKYERLLERCAGLAPVRTAVAHPCEKSALEGALEAGRKGLITPILVGPASRIEEIARRQEQISAARRSLMRRTATSQPQGPWRWFGRAELNCS